MRETPLIKCAAIVCTHVAVGRYPILRAVRDEPVDPADSGWQFLCNSGKVENEKEAQVWSVSEVLDLEPTLSQFINSPVGTILFRHNEKSQWEREKCW